MSERAKEYNRVKIITGIARSVTGFLLLFLFVLLGYSSKLEQYISGIVQNPYLNLIVFTLAVGFGGAIIFAPVKYYSEFFLEHKYDLSNQTFFDWLRENVKAMLVGLVIGIPLLLAFYYLLLHTGNLWWLYFAILLFFFSVVLAQILPVVILPLFYKVEPVENETLKERITNIAEGGGLKVKNIYKFDMSKETKKANAAFTGLGKTKRIILGDTLLENFTDDEIATVVAHEVGHYKKKHILKNILLSTAFSFITLYLISLFYKLTLPLFGFKEMTQIDALPLLVLWGMVIGLILTPVTNKISRSFEYQADEYAVEVTGNGELFANALLKLNKQNLGDESPNPLVECFFYSHPSIKKRIEFIKSVSKKYENNN